MRNHANNDCIAKCRPKQRIFQQINIVLNPDKMFTSHSIPSEKAKSKSGYNRIQAEYQKENKKWSDICISNTVFINGFPKSSHTCFLTGPSVLKTARQVLLSGNSPYRVIAKLQSKLILPHTCVFINLNPLCFQFRNRLFNVFFQLFFHLFRRISPVQTSVDRAGDTFFRAHIHHR